MAEEANGDSEQLARDVTRVSAAADSVLFALVIDSVYGGTEPWVRVDPRPLRYSHGLAIPDSSLLVEVDPAVLQMRRRVIDRLGFPETDALRDTRCTPAGLPQTEDTVFSEECPDSGRYLSVITALPREGGAYYPGGKDRLQEGLERGYWSVRTIERVMTPTGSIATILDYVVEPVSGPERWRLVEKVTLVYLD